MKEQEFVALSTVYSKEPAFSSVLANHLSALSVGSFEDAETESNVGTRKADIVATGNDGTLVVENQFGKADWDHWGRLEAYARLKEADVAVLVAEDFEELMVVTCSLRNEDSEINWYLIQARVNSHHEFSFYHVVRPMPDLQPPRGEYSEFWEPIREKGLFAGKPVLLRNDGWIQKSIRGIGLNLELNNHSCSVALYVAGEDRKERRDRVMGLFRETKLAYECSDSAKFASARFPVLDKGRKDHEHWPDVRRELIKKATDIYIAIKNSDV